MSRADSSSQRGPIPTPRCPGARKASSTTRSIRLTSPSRASAARAAKAPSAAVTVMKARSIRASTLAAAARSVARAAGAPAPLTQPPLEPGPGTRGA